MTPIKRFCSERIAGPVFLLVLTIGMLDVSLMGKAIGLLAD